MLPMPANILLAIAITIAVVFAVLLFWGTAIADRKEIARARDHADLLILRPLDVSAMSAEAVHTVRRKVVLTRTALSNHMKAQRVPGADDVARLAAVKAAREVVREREIELIAARKARHRKPV